MTSATSATIPGSLGFVPRLQSIRVIGSFMVAAFHVGQCRWAENVHLLPDPREANSPFWSAIGTLHWAISNGPGAVCFFFVLSGFVLSASIERGPRAPGAAAHRFFIRRLCRLYPAAISTVLIFAVLFWTCGVAIPDTPSWVYAPGNLLRNLLLLETNINGVMWALRMELIAAPLIFAAVFWQRRWGVAPTVVLTVILVGLSFAGEWNRLQGAGQPAYFGRLYAFLFGILLHWSGPPLGRWLRGKRAGAFFIAMLTIFLAARPFIGLWSHWTRLFESAAAAGMIAVLVFAPNTGFARVLDWPPLRFYGKLSFSIYLLHPLTLWVLWDLPGNREAWMATGVPAVAIATALTVVSLLAITPLAWLNWRFVELPGIALGRRLTGSKSGADRRGQLSEIAAP